MKNLIVICEARKDANIYEASCDAVDVAKTLRHDVEFVFQDVRLIATATDTGHTLMARYREHAQPPSPDEGQS